MHINNPFLTCRFRRFCNVFAASVLLLAGMASAHATNYLYSGTGFNDGNYGVTIGMELEPKADISVTSLGVFDGGSDGPGLETSHDVGLWAANGSLLATATITNTDTLQSGFRYAAVTPVILSAGQKYYLGVYYSNAGDKLVASILNPAPFATLTSNSLLTGSGGLTFPDPTQPGTVINSDFRITANLVYVPVDTSPVNLNGAINSAGNGNPICAMALANGKYMFSCNPIGDYALNTLPRASDGTIKLQIYAQGFRPYITTLINSGTYNISMTPAGSCPNYNLPYTPVVNPGSAGKWVDISGQILLQNSATPVCAMVLANGQHMFSCGGSGNYALRIPLDSNGQFKLQVYAQGFAPYTIKYDEFQLINTARLARAVECN